MTSKDTFRKDVFLFLSQELTEAERRRGKLMNQLAEIEHRIEWLQRVKKEFEAGICSVCKGHGEVWMQYAQDEIKKEPCRECKGSGLVKGVPA